MACERCVPQIVGTGLVCASSIQQVDLFLCAISVHRTVVVPQRICHNFVLYKYQGTTWLGSGCASASKCKLGACLGSVWPAVPYTLASMVLEVSTLLWLLCLCRPRTKSERGCVNTLRANGAVIGNHAHS